MPVLLERGGAVYADGASGAFEDPYLRVRHVLAVRTAHPPTSVRTGEPAVGQREEPETLDDCMLLRAAHIQKYRIEGTPKWASHADILSAFQEMHCAGRGIGLRPYWREEVFAPVKVVFAETGGPDILRAALAWGPVYPWQNKLATLVPGQPLALAYAAVGVLNSRYGLAWYRRILRENPPRAHNPHGLKVKALNRVPLARRDYPEQVLQAVAVYTHQLMALHEGLWECRQAFAGLVHRYADGPSDCSSYYARQFNRHIEGVERRMQPHLKRLLGLHDEAEEAALLREVDSSHSPAEPLFDELDTLMATPLGVSLFGEAELEWWNRLQASIAPPQSEVHALKTLRYWNEAINSPPPRELLAEPSPHSS